MKKRENVTIHWYFDFSLKHKMECNANRCRSGRGFVLPVSIKTRDTTLSNYVLCLFVGSFSKPPELRKEEVMAYITLV